MRTKQGIASLIAGTLIVLALLAVFAVEISRNQSQARQRLESQAHDRAVLVSGLLDAIFQQSAHVSNAERAMLSAPVVSDEVLQHLKSADDFTVLLDSNRRVIARSSGLTGPAMHAVLTDPAIGLVEAGRPWSLGNLYPYRGERVAHFAIRLPTAQGHRVLVIGFPLTTLAPFIAAELDKVPGVARQHQLMIDGHGVVIGSTVPDRPAGYVIPASKHKVLAETSGIVNGQNGLRYFDNVPLQDSTWTLALTVPVGEFFASVSGVHHWLAWIIFAAFGTMAIIALLLVARSLQAAERIRLTNDLLTESNGELAGAQVSLEKSNSALAQSNLQLERQARELARSNGELDQFASIASHDLQEPLRKVRTFTERVSELESENLSERGVDYLRRANASAERMQTLIEDLLRFSRVSTQGRPFAPVDLAEVIHMVLDDLSEQVLRTGARVEVGPMPTINADPPQMRQLLQNLISNAMKFRHEDVEPVVRIAAEVDGGWVTLTVADNGIGFDPQYSRRIFRIFERLHGRGTYPGTGIGLALCRKIAERHGGAIAADSAPGEGATFTVTMQAERTEAVADPPEPPERPGRSEPDGPDGPATREEPYVTV